MCFFYPFAAVVFAAAGLAATRRLQAAGESCPLLSAFGAGLLGGVAGGLLAAGCVRADFAGGDRYMSADKVRNELDELWFVTTGRW